MTNDEITNDEVEGRMNPNDELLIICTWFVIRICFVIRTSAFVIRTQGCSSTGRALVSKTRGCEFDSRRPCQLQSLVTARQLDRRQLASHGCDRIAKRARAMRQCCALGRDTLR